MPVINYIEADGTEYSVNVAEGVSLMQGALDNMIEGIVAECGGCCVCCTCHCMIDPAWSQAAGSAAADEAEMLEMVDRYRGNQPPGLSGQGDRSNGGHGSSTA